MQPKKQPLITIEGKDCGCDAGYEWKGVGKDNFSKDNICTKCNGKGKIQKYKVNEDIYYCLVCNKDLYRYHKEASGDVFKLKIISENPKNKNEWLAIMVK